VWRNRQILLPLLSCLLLELCMHAFCAGKRPWPGTQRVADVCCMQNGLHLHDTSKTLAVSVTLL
jgi:hypothetical protein